jgi:hypothetical protein
MEDYRVKIKVKRLYFLDEKSYKDKEQMLEEEDMREMICPDMNYKDCDTLLKDKAKWTQDYDEYPCCKTCINFEFFYPTESEVENCEKPVHYCVYGNKLQKEKCSDLEHSKK